MSYKDDLLSLNLKDGDPVAVAYRSMPVLPASGGLQRASSIGVFKAIAGDSLVYETLSGARVIDPIDDIFVSLPPADEWELVKKEHARAQALGNDRRIEVPR